MVEDPRSSEKEAETNFADENSFNKKKVPISIVEWIGTHPFSTGVLAILGFLGFWISLFGFFLDRGDASGTSEDIVKLHESIAKVGTNIQKNDKYIDTINTFTQGIALHYPSDTNLDFFNFLKENSSKLIFINSTIDYSIPDAPSMKIQKDCGNADQVFEGNIFNTNVSLPTDVKTAELNGFYEGNATSHPYGPDYNCETWFSITSQRPPLTTDFAGPGIYYSKLQGFYIPEVKHIGIWTTFRLVEKTTSTELLARYLEKTSTK